MTVCQGRVAGRLAALPMVACGHHLTSARFDTATDASISGYITRVDWRNPHVYLYVEGPNASNEQVVWEM